MARNAVVDLVFDPATGKFTAELSAGENITGEVQFQNRCSMPVKVQARPDSTPPSPAEWGGAILLFPRYGARGTLPDLFKGVDSPVRLFAQSDGPAQMSIQYL